MSFAQCGDRSLRPLRQNLLLREERAVYIRQHQRYLLLLWHDRLSHYSLNRMGTVHVRPNNSLAVATTRSGSKPNLLCSALSGADAPKVCMPITLPVVPT